MPDPAVVIMSTSGTNSFGGMLSTTYQPISSTLSAAWDRPAPLMPVMSSTSKPSAGAAALKCVPAYCLSISLSCAITIPHAGHQQHLNHGLIQ